MALETLFKARSVHRHPLLLMLHAIILGSVGIWIALLSFPQWANLLSLVFVTIGFVPIMEKLLKHEEKIEAKHPGFSPTFLARHFNIVQAYAWIFLGLIICYAFWYAALPTDTRTQIFGEQENAFKSIGNLKENLTGMASATNGTCNHDALCWYRVIFLNNTSVLILLLVLGIVFGAGAIFLLAWNASVIGVVIGKDIIALGIGYQSLGIAGGIFAFFHGIFNLLGYPHMPFEAGGYFIGAIAGGILGILATRRHYYKHELDTIIKDVIILVVIAVACIGIGALIEAAIIVSSI